MDIKHGRGALISKPDINDYVAGSYLPAAGIDMDEFIQDSIPDITYDQNGSMKCVAYSLKQLVEQFSIREYGKFIPVSVDYIFSDRTIDQDSYTLLSFEGVYPKDLIHNLYKFGACEDRLLPTHQPDDYLGWDLSIITDEMRENAKKYIIAMYLKVASTAEIKSALVNKCGVTASIPFTPKFTGGYNEQITKEYVASNNQGGHMIVIYGWTKYNGVNYWICKNTWGTAWAPKGLFYLPFEYPFNEIWALTDKIFPHWSDRYYKYLTETNGIVFDERGYDLPATRGYVFKYLAKALGYKGVDSSDEYFKFINTKMPIYEKRYDDNVTRGEMFAMLARLKGYKEPTVNIPPHWAQKYWNYLNEKCGIKILETRFNDNIKRSEAITLLARLMGIKE